MSTIKSLVLVVSFVGFVSGSTKDDYNQPAAGSSKQTQVLAKLKQSGPEDYFAGGDVCKICKVLATIAFSRAHSNSTLGYRNMYNFCDDLGDKGDPVSRMICLNQMNIVIEALKTTPSDKPEYLCTLIGACGSVKEGRPRIDVDSHVTDLNVNKSGCGCMKYNCGCCAHVEFDKIKINDTACTNFSYLPAVYGISFTVTLDDKTLINKTVSAVNPPPICVGVPKSKLADICLRFTKLNVTNSSFSGCVEIEAELAGKVIGEKQLGCFKIPLKEEHLGVGPMPLMSFVDGPLPPRKMANKRLYFKSSKQRQGKQMMYYTEARIKQGRLGF